MSGLTAVGSPPFTVTTRESSPAFPRTASNAESRSQAIAAALTFDLEKGLLLLDGSAHPGTKRGTILFESPVDGRYAGKILLVEPASRDQRLIGPTFARRGIPGSPITYVRGLNPGVTQPLSTVMAALGPELGISCQVAKDGSVTFSDGSPTPLDTLKTGEWLANEVRRRIASGTWPHEVPNLVPLPSARPNVKVHFGTVTVANPTELLRYLVSIAEAPDMEDGSGNNQFPNDCAWETVVTSAKSATASPLAKLIDRIDNKILGPTSARRRISLNIPGLSLGHVIVSGTEDGITFLSYPDRLRTGGGKGDPPIVDLGEKSPLVAESRALISTGTIKSIVASVSLAPSSDGTRIRIPRSFFSFGQMEIAGEKLQQMLLSTDDEHGDPVALTFAGKPSDLGVTIVFSSPDSSAVIAVEDGVEIVSQGSGRMTIELVLHPIGGSALHGSFGTPTARNNAITVASSFVYHLSTQLQTECCVDWLASACASASG